MKTMKKVMALALAILMLCSIVPFTAVAAETYQKVTSAADFTTGQYVMVLDTGVAPGVYESGWLTAVEPTVSGTAVTDAKGGVWSLTVSGNSVTIVDANGVAVAPKGGNNNGIKDADYQWSWAFADGKFTFSGVGNDTVTLASNKGSQNKFRAYKTTTVTGNPSGYPYQFTLYKLGGDAPSQPDEPTEPDEPDVPIEPDEPTEPDEPVEPGSNATISFDDKANRVSYSTEQQVWKQNGITVTNDKGASTSNVGDYAKPARFYKNSTVTIEYPGMTAIVIDSVVFTDNDYAKGWTDSFSANATATVVDGDVTIVFASAVDSFTWEALSAQSRAYSITVYTDGDTPEIPDVPDEPEVPSDPVVEPEADTTLSIADAIALGLSKEHNTYTAGKYYVTGKVTEVYNDTYGNMKLTDDAGNILTIYGTYSADGEIRYDAMETKPAVGDTVTIYGYIGQYNGTAQIKNGWLITLNGETPSEPSDPDTPVVPGGNYDTEIDTSIPYVLGMVQKNVSTEDIYMLNGKMDGFYMATTLEDDEALFVYLVETEGGYYLKTEDGRYINMVVAEGNDGKIHVNGVYESAPSTVYNYDLDLYTLVAYINNDIYAFGTRSDKTYTTIGPVKASSDAFFVDLYYYEEEEPVEPCAHEYDDEYDADCNLCGERREVPEKPIEYVGTIEVSSAQAEVGGTVQVTVSVKNNPGIISARVKVYYDTAVLKLTAYTAGNFTASGYSWSKIEDAATKGYFVINWADGLNGNNTAELLATLTFEVQEGAAEGTTAITPEFSCADDIFDANEVSVWFEAVAGGVEILPATPDTPDKLSGDADGDGKVNNRDLGLLQRYLNEWEVTIDLTVCDVNGDGKINNRDMGLLQQYLNGWDVVLK